LPKTFLITAATGIGAETARLLAQSNTPQNQIQIFFLSETDGPCSHLRDELKQHGATSEHLVGDLNEPALANRLISACAERFGRIDGVFNVAGISGRRFGDGPIHTCTGEGWQKTIDSNLTTQYRICREALKIMIQQEIRDGERGVILNMSSILALHPEPEYFETVAYSASKGGVLSMTRTMASTYLRDRIRVNAIAPGVTNTNMISRITANESILNTVRRKQALIDGVIPVRHVASACVFLLSDLSRSITGQCLEVDAGWGLS
jgi:NAD(P)-dependent dehydrogenase (short-subunit alcohol dehydrogenase family)